ncbi:hypothetical protein P7H71_09590 [Lactococcus lactis]|uniref:hypothetical protein n=1 Tax=Lactococcus TaxID=1357 RepID=UPI001CDB9EF8|nr:MULTISPECIES: hypothetical protein [Lactococcus]MCA2389546.1 hypothetical protein [Lactococcus sp. NH2-7C]MDT2884602.1 hypothetical protein [Lactococcus lactis]MDT2900781.1 hypothetical protein [Lactococcus lactis]MDT2922259.1 hypothetical protein [Lactococcus lactis]MDT2941270.1 hypothetical protein [Lactococcus lactis]
MASRTRRKTETGLTYRNWGESEEKMLYDFSEQGLSDSKISQLMGRSMGRSMSAIANRRYYLRENGKWDKIATSDKE